MRWHDKWGQHDCMLGRTCLYAPWRLSDMTDEINMVACWIICVYMHQSRNMNCWEWNLGGRTNEFSTVVYWIRCVNMHQYENINCWETDWQCVNCWVMKWYWNCAMNNIEIENNCWEHTMSCGEIVNYIGVMKWYWNCIMNNVEIVNSCWDCTTSCGGIANYIEIVKCIGNVNNVGILIVVWIIGE